MDQGKGNDHIQHFQLILVRLLRYCIHVSDMRTADEPQKSCQEKLVSITAKPRKDGL